MKRNMNSSAKQIQSSVSPNLRVRLSPSLTLKAFLRRLRWSKVKNCYTTAIFTHTGGLIRFYIVIWSLLSQFKWPLLFLHHRGRGHGTRLSIRTKDHNNHSDTETGTLSTQGSRSAIGEESGKGELPPPVESDCGRKWHLPNIRCCPRIQTHIHTHSLNHIGSTCVRAVQKCECNARNSTVVSLLEWLRGQLSAYTGFH